MKNDRFDESVQFAANGLVPAKLTWKDVEALTKQEVVGMVELGKWVRLTLANGFRFNIKKW